MTSAGREQPVDPRRGILLPSSEKWEVREMIPPPDDTNSDEPPANPEPP